MSLHNDTSRKEMLRKERRLLAVIASRLKAGDKEHSRHAQKLQDHETAVTTLRATVERCRQDVQKEIARCETELITREKEVTEQRTEVTEVKKS